jgi:hypothetical protein
MGEGTVKLATVKLKGPPTDVTTNRRELSTYEPNLDYR